MLEQCDVGKHGCCSISMTKIVTSVSMEGGEGKVKPWGDAGVAMAMAVTEEKGDMKPTGLVLKKPGDR